MSKFVKWLVMSSENPKEFSLTIQGILALQLPLIFGFIQEMGVEVNEPEVVKIILAVVAGLGALIALTGLVRKIINTFTAKKVVVFTAEKKVTTKKK
jgi:hypothetical protein